MTDLRQKVAQAILASIVSEGNGADAAITAVADWLHENDDEYSDDSSLYRAAVRLRAEMRAKK